MYFSFLVRTPISLWPDITLTRAETENSNEFSADMAATSPVTLHPSVHSLALMKNYIDDANNWGSYFKYSLIGEEGNELNNVLKSIGLIKQTRK